MQRHSPGVRALLLYSTKRPVGRPARVGLAGAGRVGRRRPVRASARAAAGRDLHQVAHAIGGGAVEDVGEEAVAVRRHRDQIDALLLARR